MVSINFKEFKLYTSIPQDQVRPFDVRKELSDAMYMTLHGIQAHDLALRIYRSDGEIELDDADLEIITRFAERLTPAFIDSLPANVVRLEQTF